MQLGGGLVFAIGIPSLILWLQSGPTAFTPVVEFVLLSSTLAFLMGTWQYRSIAPFPGVEGSANIISSFTISYGLMAVLLLLLRLEYTRMLVLSSYMLTLSWFYFLYFVGERRRGILIGLMPMGDTTALAQIDKIDWVPLDDPTETRRDIHAVAADLRRDIPDEWDRKIADYALAGIPVFHSKHLLESLTGQVELEHMSENSFGTLLPGNVWLRVKRFIDIVAAISALLLIWPLLIIVGIAVRLDSPGPALFRQVRTGYRGEPFLVIKFRTMRAASPDDNKLDLAKTKEDDPRITKLGAFLRRSRIDELPQLINVVKGEMSFIGPRPEAEVLSQHYEAMIPFYRYRHVVYPGISGWAQVNQGHVTEVDEVREKLHYDFYYIKNFSAWLDLLIVAKTIRTMLTGFGSR
ncbi:MAG TPA: sugar transferase [Chakrabartia sp.]|nr:sugar transferase [Chakrabartia sp.]